MSRTLIDIEHDGAKVRDWAFETVEGAHSTRFYFRPYPGEESGFEFYVIENMGYGEPFSDPWRDPTVEVVASGVAYFDGVRHLNMGDEGYLNYPSAVGLVAVFAMIRKYEERYCMKSQLTPFVAGVIE